MVEPEGVPPATENDRPASAEPTPVSDRPARNESVKGSNIGDQASEKDLLGFTPYVEAIAEFLTNEETKPPLTLSVEGGWGSGKSSFMKQLQAEIERIERSKNNPAPKMVWFNAWRHDKVEALWAAFALEFLRKISTHRTRAEVIPTWKGNFKLFLLRLNWQENWQELGRILFLSLFLGGVALALPVLFFRVGVEGINKFSNQVICQLPSEDKSKPENSSNPTPAPSSASPTPTATPAQLPSASPSALPSQSASPVAAPASVPSPSPASTPSECTVSNGWLNLLLQLAGLGGSVTGALALLAKLGKLVGDPKNDLKKYLESPDYEKQVAFIEKFHEDFEKIVTAYAGKGNKVYVFIDDLDRCELTKAAELMQGLNLLISDDPHLIFVLGMDREKVAAGIALKQKDVLPYLPSTAVVLDTATQDSRASSKGLEYGYAFIEKFVQLPFQVPQPSEENFQDFLEKMSSQKQKPQKSYELLYGYLFYHRELVGDEQKLKSEIDKELKYLSSLIKETNPKIYSDLCFSIILSLYSLKQVIQWKREIKPTLIYLSFSENSIEFLAFLSLLLHDQVPSSWEELIETIKRTGSELQNKWNTQTLQIKQWFGFAGNSLQNKAKFVYLRGLIIFDRNRGLWEISRHLDSSQLQHGETQVLGNASIEDPLKSKNRDVSAGNRKQSIADLLMRREDIKVSVTEDSETVRKIVLMVAPALDYNPRRIKQFINLFRLRTFIGSNTGLFDEVNTVKAGSSSTEKSITEQSITLEQLGKFTALCLKYPLLRVDLQKNSELLKNLHHYAFPPVRNLLEEKGFPHHSSHHYDDTTQYWGKQPGLAELFRAGCLERPPNKDCSLETVNVKKLLLVSPSVVRGVDYSRLNGYLRSGRWREADKETLKVMLKVAKRERQGYLNIEAIENFPCEDLQTIDRLWVHYSNGQFGFSVQKELYLKCGGILDGQYHEEAWGRFCQENGWQVNKSYVPVTYSTQSPLGHLPYWGLTVTVGVKNIRYSLLSHPGL